MAPKKNGASAAATPVAKQTPAEKPTTTIPGTMTSQPSGASTKNVGKNTSWDHVVGNIYSHYMKTTPQRTMLIDAFLAFLVIVGGLQFLYCIVGGNFPFNAFLAGFGANVGQFVLTVSLRMQTTDANKAEFTSISPERAFADYIVCSLVLHFFCINLIN